MNLIEWKNRKWNSFGYVALCVILLLWNKCATFVSRATCINVRFWISCVYISRSIEISNLRRSLSSSASALLLFSFPFHRFLSFCPFLLFVSQNYAPLRPLFSRTSNRILFNWWDAFRCARTYKLVYFLFLLCMFLFDSRTAFSTAFFDISCKFQQHHSFVMAVTTVGRV